MTNPATAAPVAATPVPDEGDPRRWRALMVLGLIQFMLVVDMSIVNVALPSIQRDLGFSRAGLGWVVDSYVLMAGGLLLLGGRLADLHGRRRLFLVGVALFALASGLSGAASSPAMLIAGRLGQGVGEAMAAPAALGLILGLFPDSRERAKAVGIWGGLAGLGGTTGSVLSGLLTDLGSWRLIFFVNLPIAILALMIAPRLVSERRMLRDAHQRVDVAGALCATAGLVGIVYGILEAARRSWTSAATLVPLAAGVVLLALTVALEARSTHPTFPPRFFQSRTRVVAYALNLCFTASFFSYIFLITLFEQQVLGYSPLHAGLGYLPLGVGIGLGMGLGTALMPRIGTRALMSCGLFAVAGGLLLTSGLTSHTSYLTGVLPGMALIAVGSGLSFAPLMTAALHGVTGQDSSVAAAVQSTVAQVGGALGLATFVTLAQRKSASDARHGASASLAATHGYTFSFQIVAGLMALAGIATILLLDRAGTQARNPLLEATLDPVPSSAPDLIASTQAETDGGADAQARR